MILVSNKPQSILNMTTLSILCLYWLFLSLRRKFMLLINSSCKIKGLPSLQPSKTHSSLILQNTLHSIQFITGYGETKVDLFTTYKVLEMMKSYTTKTTLPGNLTRYGSSI